jgi:hypothetical protein
MGPEKIFNKGKGAGVVKVRQVRHIAVTIEERLRQTDIYIKNWLRLGLPLS